MIGGYFESGILRFRRQKPTAYNVVSSSLQYLLYSNFEYFMGQCATGSRRDESRSYSFESQPAGTQALRYKNLPKLIFHATLANAKLKQYPYNKATAYFRVRECENFVLPAKKGGDHGTILWRINESFDFQMTEYELRKQFLEVAILKEDGEQVGSIKINLFLIATGPFHQDFAIHFPQQKVGRISFDLKISQIIDLKIESLESQILLNKKHPGQEFCYSIKTINGFSGSSVESGFSYPAVVLLQKKSEEPSLQSLLSDLQINRRKSLRQIPKQIQQGKELKWGKDGGQLPVIQTKVVASQLHNIYFQILIWKYKSQIDSTKQLFADTYISLYKLLGTQASVFKEGHKDLQSRSITVSEKIEQSGKNYGTANFKFTIINQTYFKQYLLCVHTEDGIQKTNPIFGIEGTTSTDKCAELQDLISLSNAVEQNVISLNKEQADDGARFRIRRLIKEIQEDLSSIYQILEKTYFSPSFLYNYSSEMDLLEGQKILVEFGMKLTQYVESEDPVANDLCWLILISLIKRAQFNLGHMGFNEKQKKDIQSNKIDDFLTFKQEVANMYKAFLYKLLDLALNSINHKGSDYQRTFAQIFSAYAYFCIPEFRKEILRLITSHESDPEIVEWRESDFNLGDERGRDKDKANTFKEMFDWEHHFYKYIRRDDRIQNNSISLPEILGQNEWKGRFIKRGLAFFYFIKYWVTYVDSTLHSSPYIQWNYFPGYTRLVRGFLVQLKLRPILEYPDGMIEATQKLLLNENLINPIIKILVTKVKAYDSTAVMKTISYLHMIFEAVGKRMKQVPVSFNYSFFFKAIKIMLEVDFSVTMGATLTLLYNHFNLFHLQFRRSLSMYLLGSVFFRLFLHWSHNVRYIFNHLIAYKIYRDAVQEQIGIGSSQVADIKHNDVLHRYDELMKILALELKNYQTNRKPPLHPSIAKSYFKQMKIRLYEKNKDKSAHLKQEEFYLAKNLIMSRSIESLPEINASHQNPMASQLIINIEKSSSQLWSNKKAKLIKRQAEQNLHKKDDIKRTSRFNNQFSYVHDHVGKRGSLFHQIIPETEFIIPQIKQKHLKHIEPCLIAYRQIQKVLFEGIQKGSSDPPVIQQEIAIDKREIRPGQYDEW